MLSVLVHLSSLKWAVPAACMFVPAPVCFSASQFLRVLKPVMPSAWFEAADECLWAFYQRLVLFFFENYTGAEIILYEDTAEILSKKENAIVLSNHQSTVDWIMTHSLAVRQGSLGSARFVLKDGLKYFPLYGLYFWQHSCVFVGRFGGFNEKRTLGQLRYIGRRKLPMWLILFPEGTRFNPEAPRVIEKSQQYAEKMGYVELHNVLSPRVRALQLSVDCLKQHADALYDFTIAYESTRRVSEDSAGRLKRLRGPSMQDFLCMRRPRIHVHLRRIPMSSVPKDDKKLQAWLHELYAEKDRRMSTFLTTGSLSSSSYEVQPSPSVVSRLPLRQTLPSAMVLIGISSAVLASDTGRSYYWKIWLGGSVLGIAWMAWH